MKKILWIIILCLLFSNQAFASESKFKDNPIYNNDLSTFNQWLYDNGHHQYLDLNNPVEIDYSECETGFYSSAYCYDSDGLLIKTDEKNYYYNNNLKIKFYKGGWAIPFNKNPKRDTLIYYLYKYLHAHDTGARYTKQWGKYEIKPTNNPYEFKSDLIEDKFIKKQMQKKPLLSYLFYENDKIVIDEITPKDKFGEFVDDTTKLRSNSVGKSIAAYVAGHAICEGYIESLDSKIDDWPLLKGTLYDGQKLIDILNMYSGDQKYVYNSVFWDGTEADTEYFSDNMKKMQGKKKSKPKYNYNAQNTNLFFNYVLFKSGDNFEKLLKDIFQKKVRIKDSVYFFRTSKRGSNFTKLKGDANSMFFATRYDYLRISKAIIDDWQNDTCVGKYLKTIYENRVKKFLDNRTKFRVEQATTRYGGQFHLDIIGLKDRKILGMGGYGGQQILIDVENSRIVVLNAIHINRKSHNYNWKKMVWEKIKGK